MIITILYSDCYNYRLRVIFGRCIFVASSDFMFYIWTSHSDCLISLTSSVITSSPTINIHSSSRSLLDRSLIFYCIYLYKYRTTEHLRVE